MLSRVVIPLRQYVASHASHELIAAIPMQRIQITELSNTNSHSNLLSPLLSRSTIRTVQTNAVSSGALSCYVCPPCTIHLNDPYISRPRDSSTHPHTFKYVSIVPQ